MNEIVIERLKSSGTKTAAAEKQVLREIIQEISLLGLWRGKFFEHAAFYGGTSLRILYGLDRFSEDLDFTLLSRKDNFKLDPYLNTVKNELSGFGFDVSVETKVKKQGTTIESAFVKAGTKIILLKAGSRFSTDRHENIYIKFEVDTDPATGFNVEAKQFFWPQLFSVNTCDLPSLFAGKLHAAFCRGQRQNVKGRDWYDLLWYVARKIKPNYVYLENKLRQSGHWQDQGFNEHAFKMWAKSKIEKLNISAAKHDVERFITDPRRLDGWTQEAFIAAIDRI